MIIGASSFAGPLPELKSKVESIELYIPKLEANEGKYRHRRISLKACTLGLENKEGTDRKILGRPSWRSGDWCH
jgi:hypothetical protein